VTMSAWALDRETSSFGSEIVCIRNPTRRDRLDHLAVCSVGREEPLLSELASTVVIDISSPVVTASALLGATTGKALERRDILARRSKASG
jgi:hypothetical protein